MAFDPSTVKTHKISTANSTTALLSSGATWTGSWEEVVDYSVVMVAIKASTATDGTLWIDASQDGGATIINSVPLTVTDNTFFVPKPWIIVETHIRIRYVNGTTNQTGWWGLQTKYANSQDTRMLQSVSDTVRGEDAVTIVKSVGTGDDPNGSYVNLPASGIDNNNTTTSNLGISGVFTGTWSDVRNYSEIRLSYDSDVAGVDCRIEFSPDASAVERSISVPPQANSLQSNFGAVHTLNPILPYFRVVYTNGTTAQTNFYLTTILSVTSGGGLISRATQVLNRYNDVKLQRVVNSPEQDRNFGLIGYQKAERKFGVDGSVTGTQQTVHELAADNYTFIQAAETVRIKVGGNAADDTTGAGARTITVEGLDENWDEATEDIVTAGGSASSATTTTFIRINKVFTKEVGAYGGENTGDIIIEGVTSSTELAIIKAGIGNSRQVVYSVPAGKTAWIKSINVSVGQANSADVSLYHISFADDFSAPFTSTKHFEWGVKDYSGAQSFPQQTFLKFDEKNDIIGEAKKITGGGNASVELDFDYILTDN
jgi:hypothetical protein